MEVEVEHPTHKRIATIDIARGMIMVIMALDHVRDFVHQDAQIFSPTDLTKTNGTLFLTRWITHFCAPAFVLLAGTSMAINAMRKSKAELSVFLVTRGFWLIFLDATVMRFALLFNFYYDVTFLSVLWMIGFCMVCMAALIHLQQKWMLVVGLLVLFLHNSVDGVSVTPDQWFYVPWLILMRVGFLPINEGHAIITSYALVPWLGVMILGYSLGQLYKSGLGIEERKKWLKRLGVASLVMFVILRAINIYGDPFPWSRQHDWGMTVLSFINVTKYPVSLQFILITIGPLLILLSFLEGGYGKALKPFLTIGRVPLFYFIGHFLFAHLAALFVLIWQSGKSLSEIDFHFAKSFGGIPTSAGTSLAGVYVVWIIIVLIMYPLCKLYDRYKTNHHYKWLSYL
jgi:uncharacterized membrane protein